MVDWSDAGFVARMKAGWRGGRAEGTPCGNGSLLVNTKNVREQLPYVLKAYSIRSVCDAGAGDLHWAQNIFDGIDYRPFDIVPRTPAVSKIDVSKEALPKCDAIICRHVLIHLDPPRVMRALELFSKSAPYLFASQYDVHESFDPKSQYNRTNLEARLGKPLWKVQDGEEVCCSLALWKMQ